LLALTVAVACNLPPPPDRWSNAVALELSRPRLTIASGLSASPLDREVEKLERERPPDDPKLIATLTTSGGADSPKVGTPKRTATGCSAGARP